MIIRPRNGIIGGPQDDPRWSLFAPPSPTSLSGTAGNAQVALSWSAPSVLSQTPITDYVVQFSSDSGSTWTTFSDGTATSTSATVTGLTNGTAYVFRVAAVNGVGTGAYSSASAAVTPTASVPVITIAEQPANQTASGGSATFSVAATVTQSATLSYQWQKQESGTGSFTNISGATSSSLALSNLTNADDNGDVYRCVVSATGGAESVTSSSATLTVAAAQASGYVASGAGTAAINGTYVLHSGDAQNYGTFRNITNQYSGQTLYIYLSSMFGGWSIGTTPNDTQPPLYRVPMVYSATPPLTGWTDTTGDPPAPTLSAA